MTTRKGQNLGGVLDFAGIIRRCRAVDESDPDTCLEWQGAHCVRGIPKLWFPPFQSTVGLGSVMCFLHTGKRPARGECWYARCLNKSCGRPDHWKKGTLSQATRRSPRKNPALHKAKVTATRRANAKLNEEVVAQIRAGGGTLMEWAKRLGVSHSTVARARTGEHWGPVGSLTSSVFEWRP